MTGFPSPYDPRFTDDPLDPEAMRGAFDDRIRLKLTELALLVDEAEAVRALGALGDGEAEDIGILCAQWGVPTNVMRRAAGQPSKARQFLDRLQGEGL